MYDECDMSLSPSVASGQNNLCEDYLDLAPSGAAAHMIMKGTLSWCGQYKILALKSIGITPGDESWPCRTSRRLIGINWNGESDGLGHIYPIFMPGQSE